MKAKIGILVTIILLALKSTAQDKCASFEYQESSFSREQLRVTEDFIARAQQSARPVDGVIRIPVVIHNLYHFPSEKITEQQVAAQLDLLNACFRRRNADTVHTPDVFKPFAADIEIEFVLARSDARRASTTGIIRKYSPVTSWTMDDKMKFSSEMGADGWDSRSYLNIWVVNLERFAGYASFPGGDAAKDGIVIDLNAFPGKTLVHEAGHWLGLRHLWGDELCGDDFVHDTPKQASYTPGCPKNIRITCGNGPNGDMYMNYMDFTSDACTNMFTEGQKSRMRSLFTASGPRSSLLTSTGLNTPLLMGAQVEEPDPKWLHPQLYPNPATTELTMDFSYDVRWIGQSLRVFNAMGQPQMSSRVNAKVHVLNIAALKPGIYFIVAEKPGSKIRFTFVKL